MKWGAGEVERVLGDSVITVETHVGYAEHAQVLTSGAAV